MGNGTIWLSQNFKRAVGSAEYYNNNELDNKVFGRYYDKDNIDQIGDVVLTGSNGVEHIFRVATSDDWESLANHYGGGGIAGGTLKYKEFSNGENVGATNESGFSLMLGGGHNPSVGYVGIEDTGTYITSTDNGLGSKKAYKINKDNENIQLIGGFPSTSSGNVRLIKVN